MSVLGALGLLITLCGAMAAGVSWAVITQAGWVVLATFFALDVWIVFGMAMMNVKGMGNAPDAMLLLAFAMHAVCMYLTTVWAFHARNLTALAQIRAGEAGRSIGAVWVFLAAYIVVSFFHNEAGPLRLGQRWGGALGPDAQRTGADDGQRLHQVPRGHGRNSGDPSSGDPSSDDPVAAAVDVHRVTAQERHQGQPGLRGQIHRQ